MAQLKIWIKIISHKKYYTELVLMKSLRHTHTHTHTHTHKHTRSIGEMVFILYKPYFLSPYTNPTPKPTPYRKLCAFLLSQKTHSVWFISLLKYGDMGKCPHKSPSPLIIHKSYPCHYTNLCPHVSQTHTHTHTHTTHTIMAISSAHLAFYEHLIISIPLKSLLWFS